MKTIIIALTVFVILMMVNMISCREALPTGNNIDPNNIIICDTVNIKYNPATELTTCTIRCYDEQGNEDIRFIPCNDLP